MPWCPICNAEMRETHRTIASEHVIGERVEECPNGHYAQEYAYGTYRWFVGKELFYQGQQDDLFRAIARARFWWKVTVPIRALRRWMKGVMARR